MTNHLAYLFLLLSSCATSEHRDAVAPTAERTCVGESTAAPDLVREVAESTLALRATITAVHATTAPRDATDTAAVAIGHGDASGFAGTDITELGDTWGSTLTIRLKTDLPVGATAYFFARLESYNGGQLRVGEVSRRPARADLDAE